MNTRHVEAFLPVNEASLILNTKIFLFVQHNLPPFSRMSKPLVGVRDYEQEAQRRLPKAALDYYRSGALDEVTLKENIEAMNR